MSHIEERLAELGLELPEYFPPAGSYIPAYRTGNLVYTAAVGPRRADGTDMTGVVGRDCTVEQGYEAARIACWRMLGNVKTAIGDLDRVTHVVKILGMVQSSPDFNQYSQVVNGCSDLLVELFGDAGQHARTSMGVTRNPYDLIVSLDGVFEVDDSYPRDEV